MCAGVGGWGGGVKDGFKGVGDVVEGVGGYE